MDEFINNFANNMAKKVTYMIFFTPIIIIVIVIIIAISCASNAYNNTWTIEDGKFKWIYKNHEECILNNSGDEDICDNLDKVKFTE